MFQSLYQIFDINVFVYGGGVMKLGERFVRASSRRTGATADGVPLPGAILPAELATTPA